MTSMLVVSLRGALMFRFSPSFWRFQGLLTSRTFARLDLWGGIYKIIVKILANRLKMVLEMIISKS
jgi:hypothetical protein